MPVLLNVPLSLLGGLSTVEEVSHISPSGGRGVGLSAVGEMGVLPLSHMSQACVACTPCIHLTLCALLFASALHGLLSLLVKLLPATHHVRLWVCVRVFRASSSCMRVHCCFKHCLL